MMAKLDISSSVTKHHINDNTFYESSRTTSFSRLSQNGGEDTVFKTSKINIYCNGEKVDTILIGASYSQSRPTISGNQMTVYNVIENREINGNPIGIIKNHAICYHEGDTQKVVKFNEINSQKESKTLTAILKELILDGDVAIYANSHKYLKKYESKFANSISKRYADLDFTEKELETINQIGYRTEYLAGLK